MKTESRERAGEGCESGPGHLGYHPEQVLTAHFLFFRWEYTERICWATAGNVYRTCPKWEADAVIWSNINMVNMLRDGPASRAVEASGPGRWGLLPTLPPEAARCPSSIPCAPGIPSVSGHLIKLWLVPDAIFYDNPSSLTSRMHSFMNMFLQALSCWKPCLLFRKPQCLQVSVFLQRPHRPDPPPYLWRGQPKEASPFLYWTPHWKPAWPREEQIPWSPVAAHRRKGRSREEVSREERNSQI